MIESIIKYSINNKLIILLFTMGMVGFGIYSLLNIPIGAVPDVTNNQVQVITTSRNLATQDVEKFLTYPVELEMANLPGVKEIRSISKFGLSVVTIVFEDRMGTYLPRQLIAEKIKSAEEKIPKGFGSPTMGPVTTGLGEIYQYVLDVDSAYLDRYTVTDLRTIQDWNVKRQLSGIPGVVEVNTWGGYLKQYEVSINPSKLKSMNISISTIFSALEKNNSVAGGGYIEKSNQSYFIRGEGLITSLDDIENIVLEKRGGMPLYIKDVAKVSFGSANRFGAITGNGEGEKILGQVMMLKDANSNEVIKNVKERVAQIQATLPKGVHINGFLERSELIGKTTLTIAENLILGCLIVIFVVVLLLGNWRSGLVVASVIPLCLLFAISLMKIFGVDANLMSLGAIDFGIIIDGAVIIVEYIAYKVTSQSTNLLNLSKIERQSKIDDITFSSATKMMRSAIFGQLIIIIVFIPILSLSNVEGKMFKPMALVFCFALIGAMILCFTYIPVVASLFIKPTISKNKSISERLLDWLQNLYRPAIAWALENRSLVLSFSAVLLIISGFIFSRMGGEFVPTLDEGDFVIQPVLKTGTTLSNTIEITTQIEKILLQFPEVDQVVSRIGAAEIPTDPMSMEESDVIIKLKPKDEWSTAESKDELADKFKEALSILPGIDFEFTQPIEMRFNELITGVRADLAIKIFGEDLDLLYKKALEVEKAIANVEGASDISVEKVIGLPQMAVKYDREKLAKYGLNVSELNDVLSMAFAGVSTGVVFEGEKQFDLVVRYDAEHRKDIDNIAMTSIKLPNGFDLPFTEFADISYSKGPAKISRDNTKRRIVVGVNVRNRDLESVVKDVQGIIADKIDIPTGYTIEYGGQFENLRSARSRLMIAVPIALFLIFVMLHFAFKSMKEALMIYSAIPLSAVGGVMLLYLRDLPFSISAGVGFIALFGIAVLNGIVLIEHFKELKIHKEMSLKESIILGATQRLRPVLLTAGAAALGFLPMAISHSAGAEVQRPLATVVIGGLISATILTLFVLPVLYSIFDDRLNLKLKPISKTLMLVLLIICLGSNLRAQNRSISIDEALLILKENNSSLKASKLNIISKEQLQGTSFDPNKTRIYYNYDQNNIAQNGRPINVIGINQEFKFPTIYNAQKGVYIAHTQIAKSQYLSELYLLEKNLYKSFNEAMYYREVSSIYRYLDSLYQDISNIANKRYQLGESSYLEKLTSEAKKREFQLLLKQAIDDETKSVKSINSWLQSDIIYSVEDAPYDTLSISSKSLKDHPSFGYFNSLKSLKSSEIDLQKKQYLPDLDFSLFYGYNNYLNRQDYLGVEVGVSIPIFYNENNSRIKAKKTEALYLDQLLNDLSLHLESKFESSLVEIEKHLAAIKEYRENGKVLSDQMIMVGKKQFLNGELDLFQYLQIVENAKRMQIFYLQDIFKYNEAVIEANYIFNN